MAGLNIPKRSELPRGTFLGDVNNARLDAQAKLSDYAERASGVAGDMLFGEDTGDGMLKDLVYGLVPGGSLFQRATTGTRPGLLDFADFVPDSNPIDWLASDPHGMEFYKSRQYYDWEGNPKPRTIDEDKVAREGFAQFVESIPYTDLGRTPARRKLVELAEKDPRRSDDFTINFDRLEDYLSQPADKYDEEIRRNVVPYLSSF